MGQVKWATWVVGSFEWPVVYLLRSHCWVFQWKNFANRSIFDDVTSHGTSWLFKTVSAPQLSSQAQRLNRFLRRRRNVAWDFLYALRVIRDRPCTVPLSLSVTMMSKQVEKDGSFKIAEMSSRGGRTFVGLCSLLTEFEVRHTLLQFGSTVYGKKVSPKVVCHFLSSHLEFLREILHVYYLFIYT